MFREKLIPFRIRALIADAPATFPCSKFKVSGCEFDGQKNLVYTSSDGAPRTHEEYIIRTSDGEHFKPGRSPVEFFLEDVVHRTPFEYMHLILLGIMKKLLCVWVDGVFNSTQKLKMFRQFKATEHRLFLLYTGVVTRFGVIGCPAYLNCVMFHAAIRSLTQKNLKERDLIFAEMALSEFISSSVNLYGQSFASYNLHCLKHLTEDVKLFGNVDNFPAFPFENNVAFFQKATRKDAKQL